MGVPRVFHSRFLLNHWTYRLAKGCKWKLFARPFHWYQLNFNRFIILGSTAQFPRTLHFFYSYVLTLKGQNVVPRPPRDLQSPPKDEARSTLPFGMWNSPMGHVEQKLWPKIKRFASKNWTEKIFGPKLLRSHGTMEHLPGAIWKAVQNGAFWCVSHLCGPMGDWVITFFVTSTGAKYWHGCVPRPISQWSVDQFQIFWYQLKDDIKGSSKLFLVFPWDQWIKSYHQKTP